MIRVLFNPQSVQKNFENSNKIIENKPQYFF